MRFGVVVSVVALALVWASSASGQGEDDLAGRAGREVMLCANGVLEYLYKQPSEAYSPIFHLGLTRYFLGCAYPPLPASVGVILDTMQADIEAIHRHREILPDPGMLHRDSVCKSWWAIYSSTYKWLTYEYGSGIVADLPKPEDHEYRCDMWVANTVP